jgi:hypothetical protein
MKKLDVKNSTVILNLLEERFKKNMHRHKAIKWDDVKNKLITSPEKIWSLNEMEKTGGEPDLIGFDKKTNEYLYIDCSKETPVGRRSVCYDKAALDARKENKPKHSALGMADEMGIELLTEEEYRTLQSIENFDTKTSSWLKTPEKIRKLGGAIFGEYRYNNVFIFHNGVQSYYAVRGFRGILKV